MVRDEQVKARSRVLDLTCVMIDTKVTQFNVPNTYECEVQVKMRGTKGCALEYIYISAESRVTWTEYQFIWVTPVYC